MVDVLLFSSEVVIEMGDCQTCVPWKSSEMAGMVGHFAMPAETAAKCNVGQHRHTDSSHHEDVDIQPSVAIDGLVAYSHHDQHSAIPPRAHCVVTMNTTYRWWWGGALLPCGTLIYVAAVS